MTRKIPQWSPTARLEALPTPTARVTLGGRMDDALERTVRSSTIRDDLIVYHAPLGLKTNQWNATNGEFTGLDVD